MSNLAKKIKQAPSQPGCYLFQNAAGSVIYIGKAKNIKKRVSSYFRQTNFDPKTQDLVKEIADVEFIVTDNEVEAFLLEAQLIKKYQPKYNLELKGGQRYAYIQITNEKFPRLITTRLVKKGDQVFGPFTSGQARQDIIRLADRLFKLRINKRMSKRDQAKGRIRLATSPWLEEVSEEEYGQRLEKVILLLKGQNNELIKKLTAEMKVYAEKKNYEQAKLRRDQIFALENVAERQKIELRKAYDQDVINYLVLPNKIIVQLFNINKGIISGRKEFILKNKISGDDQENFVDFLKQYYYTEDIPQEIILPQNLAERKVLEEYFSRLAGRKVIIAVPQKGDKLKLLALVSKNIEITLNAGDSSLLELQNQLSLPALPRLIEAFDISNLGPTDVVGSMVQFRDGKPDKNNYRRFKIKTFVGQSDFEAMKEIIYRRYYRITKEKSQLPDLIMVDGGKPQLSAAKSSLRALGMQAPVIALAKKEEEIYTLNRHYPLKLSKKSAGLKLLQRIRDEAHRFAINYQRLLRNRKDFV
ncbi:MAG: excinuclease ABC subunit UvrC [Patescibacteria group bacterium]|jgi:excinuclease ABC subunit C